MKNKALRAAGGAVLALAMLTAAGCAGAGGGNSTGGGDATLIPLGASMEMTGAAASTGVPWSRGVELAVEQANGKDGFEVDGKKYKWDLKLNDNQSLPDKTISDYRGFVGSGVKFIAGPALSSSFVPAFNALGNAPALVLTPSSIAKTVKPKADQSVFITLSNGEASFNQSYAQAVLDATGAKTVAIALPQDAVSDTFTKLFTDFFTSKGVKIVDTKRFPPDTTNFAPYINSLQAANPELVLTGYLDKWAATLMQQSSDAGFTSANWMMTVGSTQDGLAKAQGDIKKVFFPIPVKSVVNEDDAMLDTFRTLWTEKYGSAPVFNDFNALAYYDPILMLTQAMKDAKSVTDVKAISDALVKVTTWDGAASEGGFDPEVHVRTYPVNYGVLEDGKATYFQVK